jgi:hypothetical protein
MEETSGDEGTALANEADIEETVASPGEKKDCDMFSCVLYKWTSNIMEVQQGVTYLAG